MHRNPEEYIGVDVGSRRVGLARGSSIAKIAEPLKVVDADKAMNELAQLAADAIVVGLPRGLNGQETDQTKEVRQWAAQAKLQIKKPFYWQDEALTSVVSSGDDANAARLILQDFLDTPANQRVRC